LTFPSFLFIGECAIILMKCKNTFPKWH